MIENLSPVIPFVRYDRWGRRRVMRRFGWGFGGLVLGFVIGKFVPNTAPGPSNAEPPVAARPDYRPDTPLLSLHIDPAMANASQAAAPKP